MSEELDGPIEIELTSHAPTRSRGRRQTPLAGADVAAGPTQASAPPESTGGSPDTDERQAGWLGSERSRLLVSVSAAAVIALLIGWMLGRTGAGSTTAGDDAAPTATAAVTTEPDNAEEADPAFEGAEELPDADVDLDDPFTSPTTAPPFDDEPTITTEPPPANVLPPAEQEAIEIAFDERVLGRDLTLITADGERRLLEIDLSTGTVSQRGEDLPSLAEGLFGGTDWVGIGLQSSGDLLIDRGDAGRTQMDGVPWWSMLVDAERDVVWGNDGNSPVGPGQYVERNLDGEPTGRVIDLPIDTWSLLYDDGAFLVTVIGSTYRIDPDGHELITSGQILAASSSTLVLSDCDEALRCGLRVVDRLSGDERWLRSGTGESAQRYLPMQWFFGGPSGHGSLSPDGRWMPVVAPTDTSQDIGLLDLQTGDFVEIDGLGLDGYGAAWAWAPDSRTAFFVKSRVPWVFDVATGESFRLSEDRLTWSGILVRENDPG